LIYFKTITLPVTPKIILPEYIRHIITLLHCRFFPAYYMQHLNIMSKFCAP
jgi:hypothetical protein